MFQPAEEAPEFPAPPPFFALFTPGAAGAGAAAEQGQGDEQQQGRDAKGSQPPFPIEPPPIPAADEPITIFGFPLEMQERYSRIVPQEQQMYEAAEEVEGPVALQVVDHKRELIRLNHVLLKKFLVLVDCMKTSPRGDRHQALQDLGIVVDNMYDLLSGYRQHQALLELADRLRVQLDEKRQAIADLTRGISEARQRLKEANQTFLTSHAQLKGPESSSAMDTN